MALVDRDPGDEQPDADLDVYLWRMERLVDLGYSLDQAAELANTRFDIHDLERLLSRGCDHDTAILIVA